MEIMVSIEEIGLVFKQKSQQDLEVICNETRVFSESTRTPAALECDQAKNLRV